MKILFVASTGVVTPDPPASRKLLLDALELPLDGHIDEYYFSDTLEGSKHFGVWPLADAAESCFGTSEWPSDRMVPQASIEFEVASEEEVKAAEEELVEGGFDLLHATKKEPWGQTVVRVQGVEGVIIGISYAPWLHEEDAKGE